jgi:23S rRNA (adenine2503-C2)-methyltransferase
MATLTLVEMLRSKVDKTRKLTYILDRASGPTTIEVGVIDKEDGKNILCVPTQTNCAQACRFCHTTRMAGKVAVSNLTASEMIDIVTTAWVDAAWDRPSQPLLVSFMGVGEPLANLTELLEAIANISRVCRLDGTVRVRFGLATMLPEKHLSEFEKLTQFVEYTRIPLKLHLSLHYPTTAQRREWMPATSSVGDALALLQRYRTTTGNPVEIHYTLILGVNDSIQQIYELGRLCAYHGGSDGPLPVKFLKLNPLPGDAYRSPDQDWINLLRDNLNSFWNVNSEYYASPGADIAAACGQFMADAYIPSVKSEKFGPTQVELSADFFPALKLHQIIEGATKPRLSQVISNVEAV